MKHQCDETCVPWCPTWPAPFDTKRGYPIPVDQLCARGHDTAGETSCWTCEQLAKSRKPVQVEPMRGPGGAPTRATTLPESAAERKQYPIASGVLDYFPDAIAAIAHLSWKGNEQHNPGQPLHWAREKSTDETDTMMRHYLQRGTLDTDGMRHTAKMAWRALAILQKEIEAEVVSPVYPQDLQWRPKECGCTNRTACSLDYLPHPNLVKGMTGLEPRGVYEPGLSPDDRYMD